MMLIDILVVLAFSLWMLYVYERERYLRASRGLPLPPGPPGGWLFGNIRALTQHEAPRLFAQYKKQFGDLIMLQGLGNRILVVNSAEIMNDLYDKRASKYSNRPNLVFAGELVGLNKILTLMPYGGEWRAQRKVAHTALKPAQLRDYHRMQEEIAGRLCKALLSTPEDFNHHIHMSTGGLMIAITYGIPVSPIQASYIADSERAGQYFAQVITPGRYLCDLLPILKYAPSWVAFQQEAVKIKDVTFGIRRKPFEHVKRDMAAGTAMPSLVQTALSAPPADVSKADFEWRVMIVAGDMFGAGSDTTHASVSSFLMAMALNRDRQLKAQAELDSVVGGDRLPVIEDSHDLPYVMAIVKETMRWQPAVPMGVARCSTEDDFYGQYYIPKNTTVIANVWAIAHAPNEKYDPDKFIPERFLDPTQSLPDPMTWAFGFGRRICPGRYLAENSIFIFIATVLAVFDIYPPGTGHIKEEFVQGLVRSPVGFQCKFVPRSSAKAEMVQGFGN